MNDSTEDSVQNSVTLRDENGRWIVPPRSPGRPRGESMKSTLYKAVRDKLTKDRIEEMAFKFLEKAHSDDDSWQAKAFATWFFGPDMVDAIDAWADRGEKREKAFLHYQIHKGATDVQRQILFSQAKYIGLMAGRRGGKSEGLVRWFTDEFVDNPGSRCLYIGLTITRAMELLWQPILDQFQLLGIKVKSQSRVEGTITIEGDGVMRFGGNNTKDEREKNRGPLWDRVAVDECQSQKELLYLVESILSPTLLDRKGQIALAGTGPKVRGTYWEAFFLGVWADGRPLYQDNSFRINWNLSQNPFIPDHETALADIRKEKNLTENDPLYIREYLGRIAYDDDALVLRLGEKNAFTDADLVAWIKGQPVTDVRFTSGLDFGFEDADAFEIIAYSVSKPERFLVYEWKARRQGTEDIAEACRNGIAYLQTSPIFREVVNKDLQIWADTGGNAITPYDLSTTYKLPIQAAFKAEKEMGFELLQGEVRTGNFKARKDGPFWEECLKTIYKRDEQDNLTRTIDDETFHPDAIPATIYGMRNIWMFG
jgi:hypothetical protein